MKAVDLVSDRGVTALTIKNLAASAGLTEGAIYRHFEDKHHLLLSMLEFFMESQRLNIAEQIAKKGPPLEILGRLVSGKLQTMAKNPSLSVSLFQGFFLAGEETLQAKAREIITTHREFINSIIIRGQVEGGIRTDIPADHVCLHMIGAMRFLVLQWIISGFGFDLVDRGRELWESTRKLISTLTAPKPETSRSPFTERI